MEREKLKEKGGNMKRKEKRKEQVKRIKEENGDKEVENRKGKLMKMKKWKRGRKRE